jgi:hypothetical protein
MTRQIGLVRFHGSLRPHIATTIYSARANTDAQVPKQALLSQTSTVLFVRASASVAFCQRNAGAGSSRSAEGGQNREVPAPVR